MRADMAAPNLLRLVLVAPAVAALIFGMLSGLARLGIAMPTMVLQLVPVHGALMIGAFFGGLIGLERAVAAGRLSAYAGPAFSAVGGLALIFGAPVAVAAACMTAASLCMTLLCIGLWRRQRVGHHAALAAAALAWFAGNVAWWMQGTLIGAVPLWASFLILTIAAERLELSRFVPTSRLAIRLFAIIVAGLLAAACASALGVEGALRVFAAALIALAAWLLRYDIARRTIRSQGLTRYMAVCLLSGYVWLAAGAVLGTMGGFALGHAWRDAALHAVLLGFVFSMVFAHAPVILPALARVRFQWHAGFYLPLSLLHAGLIVRIASVVMQDFSYRQYGAMANTLVLLLFFAMSLAAIRPRPSRPPR